MIRESRRHTHPYTPTPSFLSLSLKRSTDCKGNKRKKGPALAWKGSYLCCKGLPSSLPAHYWPQSIMSDYRLLPADPCKAGSLPGGGNTESRIPVATWHITLVTWHTVHFAVVTWQSPWRLGRWNIRDFCDGNAFAALQDYVWHFSFCLCLSISYGAQGHWEMSKSSVSVLSEQLMGHLWLSACWQAN